jgi:hypothetical protein
LLQDLTAALVCRNGQSQVAGICLVDRCHSVEKAW